MTQQNEKLPTQVGMIDKYCASLLRHPIRHLSVYLMAVVIITGLVVGLDAFELSSMGSYDFSVPTGQETIAADAYLDALDKVNGSSTGGSAIARSSPVGGGAIQILYDNIETTKTIFTPLKLQAMCEFEQVVVGASNYTSVCLAQVVNGTTGDCMLPQTSFVATWYSVFYPNFDYSDCPLLTEGDVSVINAQLDAMLDTPTGRDQIGFFVDDGYDQRGFPISSRVMIQLGGPLEGYAGEADRANEQQKVYLAFQSQVQKRLFEKYGLENSLLNSGFRTKLIAGDATNSDEQISIKLFSFQLLDVEVEQQITGDMLMLVAVLLFVAFWMALHTGSMFITWVNCLAIMCSLVVGFMIYRFLFGIPYYTNLHILAVFLLLGIGADNTFVLYDAWVQYGTVSYPERVANSGLYQSTVADIRRKGAMANPELSLARLVAAYKHAASSVFNTSFTTAVAFIATAISPIMPVSSFGIYAAVCVIINFLYVVTLVPASIAVHHQYIENKSFCKALCCCIFSSPAVGSGDDEEVENVQKHKASWSIVDSAFENIYIPSMLYKLPGTDIKIVPLVIVLISVIYTSVSATWAAQLQAPLKDDEIFSKDHMFTGFQQDFIFGYISGTNDLNFEGTVTWGIKGIDRTGFNRFIPDENRGSVVWDNQYELADPRAQQLFLNVCDELEQTPCEFDGCDANTLASNGTLVCFMKDFQEWLSLPINGGLDSLNLGNTNPSEFYAKLKTFSTTTTQPKSDQDWTKLIGFQGAELKFATIKFASTVSVLTATGIVDPVKKLFAEVVQDTVNEYIETRPTNEPRDSGLLASLTTYIDLLGDANRWIESTTNLSQGMVSGLLICFPVSFLVLLVATRDLRLAVFAILAIASIVTCVMGFVQHAMGWYLGISEALVAVLIVGFSVDYVVHLGHSYMEAGSVQFNFATREERFQHAAKNMGPTTLAGAITTGGAGIFMFVCQMAFFPKWQC